MAVPIAQPAPVHSPLGSRLTIGQSPIEGFGLFADEPIGGHALIGISHVYTDDPVVREMFSDGWVRSPWGSWYNMDAEKYTVRSKHIGNPKKPKSGDYKVMYTEETYLSCGTELIASDYSLYVPGPTTYRPLPPGMTVRLTERGIGVFATQAFEQSYTFGLMEVFSEDTALRQMHAFRDGWIQSPWGALLRPADEGEFPTCSLYEMNDSVIVGALVNIEPGMELTILS